MFPMSILLKETSKAEYFIFSPVGLQLFLLVLQIVRFHFTLVEMNHIGRGSGDDPPCMGIVWSIKAHPWHSPHVVCHRNHPEFGFWCLAQHS